MTLASTRFSHKEEMANSISHLSGAVLALFALISMLVVSIKHGNGWDLTGSLVFGFSLFLLYLSSTMNHSLKTGKAKEFFFTFDQIAIYLLIAGTYTPFAIIAIKGTLGWIIFGIEWGLALIGILVRIFKLRRFASGVNAFGIISYFVMGWLILIAVPQTIEALTLNGFIWVLAGGFFYTVGIVFFKLDKMKFNHLIWHLFVIAGSISHFIAVFFYVLL